MKTKIYFCIMFIITLFISSININSQEKIIKRSHYYIKIFFDNDFTFKDALNMGLDFESAKVNDSNATLIVNDYELLLLKNKNIKFDDLTDEFNKKSRAYYHSFKNKGNNNLLSNTNFKLGSFRGFYTEQELADNFNLMKAKFPQYLKKVDSIGTSIEGRTIYAYCFGNLDSNKPQMLFTAVHHAREAGGFMSLSYFIWNLMESADAGNSEAKFLLNNREIWVVPILNPDGFMVNQKAWEDNGKDNDIDIAQLLWRKNHRLNSNGTYGVDLNRNYGPDKYWSTDQSQSATTQSLETYHGTSAFSEPETQAIRDFCLSHHFTNAVNYHTYGRHIIYPYAVFSYETIDSILYRNYSMILNKENHYNFATDLQALRYMAVGGSDDWQYYSDSIKNKTISLTPEIGNWNDGFWPPPERTLIHCQETLRMNYEATWSAGVNIRPMEYVIRYDTLSKKSFLCLILQNVGTITLDSILKMKVKSLDTKVTIKDSIQFVTVLNPGQKFYDTIEVVGSINFRNGDTIKIELYIPQDFGYSRIDTITVQPFQYNIYSLYINPEDYYSKCDTSNTKWGLELDTLSGKTILTDSPNRNYINDLDNYIYTKEPFYVKYKHETLEFDTHWQTDWDMDVAVIQVSTDNGSSWKYLVTDRMVQGYGIHSDGEDVSKISEDTYGFSGNCPEWIHSEVSLDALFKTNVTFRLGLLSSEYISYKGWYISNMFIREYPDSIDTSSTKDFLNPSSLNIKVYPTPIKIGQRLIADFSTDLNFLNQNIDVKVYDCLGNLVINELANINSIPQTRIYIPTYMLGDGVYNLILSIGSKVYNSKFYIGPY